MKIKTDEINAIVSKLLEQQKEQRKVQEDAFRKKMDDDPRFEEIARFFKNIQPDFGFAISINQKSLCSESKIVKELKEDFFSVHFEYSGLKTETQLRNDVILTAPKCDSFDEIINRLTVFTDGED